MSLRYALLALLAEGEGHGYQLSRGSPAGVDPLGHPKSGRFSRPRRALGQGGLAARRDELGGRRGRRFFRLTPRGERALRAWLARRPGWPPPIRDEIFVRFLAAERHGTAAVRAQVDRQEEEYRRYLALVHEQAARDDASM